MEWEEDAEKEVLSDDKVQAGRQSASAKGY